MCWATVMMGTAEDASFIKATVTVAHMSQAMLVVGIHAPALQL